MDKEPTAFHRTLFLFVSPQVNAAPRGLCAALTLPRQGNQLQQPGAVRAFRSQLPRANQFYAFEPAGAPPQSSAVPPGTGSERSHRAAEDDAAALSSATAAAVAGCVLTTALSYSTSHAALGARWADSAPYPEWELVTDEEPCDGAAAGGVAAELPTAEPSASLAAAAATGSGDQEQARAERWAVQLRSVLTQAAQEEDGGEEDMADFEDSAEQAHFSAFTARVRSAALGCLASFAHPSNAGGTRP